MTEDCTAQREMTLEEWCAELPDTHRVNVEYRALKAQPAVPEGHKQEPVAYVVYPRSIHRTYPKLTFTKPEPSSDIVVVNLYVCAND